jgi:hypothetical protein
VCWSALTSFGNRRVNGDVHVAIAICLIAAKISLRGLLYKFEIAKTALKNCCIPEFRMSGDVD